MNQERSIDKDSSGEAPTSDFDVDKRFDFLQRLKAKYPGQHDPSAGRATATQRPQPPPS